MEERSLTDTYVKETLIGIAAASFSIFVILGFMGGGDSVAFSDSITLLLFGYITPIVWLPKAPWLIILYAVTGVALYQQYRRVPPRFIRYLVGAEVIVWQVIGLWLVADSVTH